MVSVMIRDEYIIYPITIPSFNFLEMLRRSRGPVRHATKHIKVIEVIEVMEVIEVIEVIEVMEVMEVREVMDVTEEMEWSRDE